MKKLIVLATLNIVFSQDFEVDGDLKVTGNIVFDDETSIATATDAVPAGVLVPFAGSTSPDGWLLCDGSAVSRTTYIDLFAVISTIYGEGDGSATFNLPDMGGKGPKGYDTNNSKFDSLNKTSGEESHRLTTDEMPSHIHNIQYYYGGGGSNALVPWHGSKYLNASSPQNPQWYTDSDVRADSTGGESKHNVLDPYVTLNFIIKY